MRNKCNVFESSWNHPPQPVHGKTVFHETGAKKVGDPCCIIFSCYVTLGSSPLVCDSFLDFPNFDDFESFEE